MGFRLLVAVAGAALMTVPASPAAATQPAAASRGVDVVSTIEWVRTPDSHPCPEGPGLGDAYCDQEFTIGYPKGDTFINVTVTRKGKPVNGGRVKVAFTFYVNRLNCGLKVDADGWVREVCEPWRSRDSSLTQTVALDANGQGRVAIVCPDRMSPRWKFGVTVDTNGVANGFKTKNTYYNAKGKKVAVDKDAYFQPRTNGLVCFKPWPAVLPAPYQPIPVQPPPTSYDPWANLS